MADLFFNTTATPKIYTLSLHDALPISMTEPEIFVIADQTLNRVVGQIKDEQWDMKLPDWFQVGGQAGDDITLRTIIDRKSTRLNSSHTVSSYAVFCLKKKKKVSKKRQS